MVISGFFWSQKLQPPEWAMIMAEEVPGEIGTADGAHASDAGLQGIVAAVKRRRGTSGWGYVTICLFLDAMKLTLQVTRNKVAMPSVDLC